MEEKRIKISIPSKIEAIDGAVVKTVDFAKSVGFDEDAIFGIDMAVREAVANAVIHGNQLDESKQVEIDLKSSVENFQINIRDYGEGFLVEDVPDPTNPENLMKEDGRGILFMQNFIDTVEWHVHTDGGMLVKMVKNH